MNMNNNMNNSSRISKVMCVEISQKWNIIYVTLLKLRCNHVKVETIVLCNLRITCLYLRWSSHHVGIGSPEQTKGFERACSVLIPKRQLE